VSDTPACSPSAFFSPLAPILLKRCYWIVSTRNILGDSYAEINTSFGGRENSKEKVPRCIVGNLSSKGWNTSRSVRGNIGRVIRFDS
jgi:hypothetical protein